MKEIHLICNAHLDPIWQWTEDEGMFAALSTFRSAAELCSEFDYIFCHNEALLYERVKQYAPDLFEKIQRLAKEGKWHIMGGWYLQPDCNMPSGESFVRQILTGKRFFEENFGVFPTTAINFDPFGHTKGLVQIISKCGQDSCIITRPDQKLFPMPSPVFLWEGFAGSSICVYRASSYNSPLGSAAHHIEEKANETTDQPAHCVLWGVGNHGGGPSRKDLSDIAALQKKSDTCYLHSTPEAFFAHVKPQCSTDRSLRISMPGCYTSMSRLKRKHIELENILYFTEKLCSVAAKRKRISYPAEKLDEAVKDLLTAEFHDVLPGTVIQSGEENGIRRMDHALSVLTDLRAHAFYALSQEFPTAKPGAYPILVFNPHPYELTADIPVEFSLADQNWSEDTVSQITVYDQNHLLLPSQTIKEESNLHLDWRKKIVFHATLAPLAISAFTAKVELVPLEENSLCGEFSYEDEEKSVKIDARTGLLTGLCVSGKEVINGGILPMLFEDNADPWGMGAFQQEGMGRNGSAFHLMERPDGIFRGMKPIQVIEDGELLKTVEAFFEKADNRIRMQYTVYKKQPFVDLHLDVFFSDSDRMLKLIIPTAFDGEFVGQTAFGVEPLFTDGRECVSQRFVALCKRETGFAVLNNCQYGSSFQNGEIMLSLLRGAGYCAHPIGDRSLLPDDRFTKRMDQGWLTYDFRLVAGNPDIFPQLAAEFNQPPYALNVFPDGSAIPTDFSVICKNPKILLEAFKQAEDQNDYILHLFNGSSKSEQTKLKIGKAEAELSFLPYEIKSFRLSDGMITETDALQI